MNDKLQAPFPYYGGKRRWAKEIWDKLGHTDYYVEPFAGSLAALLAKPVPSKTEIVNDTNGFISNFWRATKHDPEAVAFWCDNPTIQHDLNARHKWMNEWLAKSNEKLFGDPDFYDAKVAGWWSWFVSNCPGSSSRNPNAERRIFIHMSAGTGQGVQRQKSNMPYGSLYKWFEQLQNRMSNVFIFNLDFEKCLTERVLGYSNDVAVFLDPPYLLETRTKKLYDHEDDDIAHRAWIWAIEHGSMYRIAYAMGEGDFAIPDGWTTVYKDYSFSKHNRDCIVFSPKCLKNQYTLPIKEEV